jgi:hypothetical protein
MFNEVIYKILLFNNAMTVRCFPKICFTKFMYKCSFYDFVRCSSLPREPVSF